jgi:ubiquinone/menaquinone biosynthesis C-methylase UbiE
MSHDGLKEQVKEYWDRQACGTWNTQATKLSRRYFEEIEDVRYRVEPGIFSFAQFTRFRGAKVLEVGVGAGTDFVQWVRAGAEAYGVDLTPEAIRHVVRRLQIEGLEAAEVRVADAEALPFPDESFDLVYSWGVLHHSPDTARALEEAIRCTRPGGSVKVMLYNRRSLYAFYSYLRFGLFRGRPWRSVSDIFWHDQESPGTKAFTFAQVRRMVASQPVEIVDLRAEVTSYDLLWNRAAPFRWAAYWLACLLGFRRCGWFMTIELRRSSSGSTRS